MSSRRVLFWVAIAVLGASSLAATRTASPLPQASRKIEGIWVVTKAERELDAYPELEGATVTFTDKTFRIERTGERSVWFGNLGVDYSKGTIDFVHQAKLMIPPVYGVKWEGIFRFKGDTLEICTAEGHDARPTEFLSGYDLTLMELRRK